MSAMIKKTRILVLEYCCVSVHSPELRFYLFFFFRVVDFCIYFAFAENVTHQGEKPI